MAFGGDGDGGGGGDGGDGDGAGPEPPHHLALCPLLQLVRQVSLFMQPGLVLHRPQLQWASQL